MSWRKKVTLTVAPALIFVCCSSATAGQFTRQLHAMSNALQSGVSAFNASVGGISSCGDVSLKSLNEIDDCLIDVQMVGDTKSGYAPAPRLRNIWSEDMLLQEMARRSKFALECHLPFIKSLAEARQPLPASVSSFNAELTSRFKAIRPEAQRIRQEHDRTFARMYRPEMFACNSFEDKIKNPCLPAEFARLKSKLAELDSQLHVLVSTIPLATDPDVQDTMLALLSRETEPSVTELQSQFHNAVKKVYVRMANANRELTDAQRKLGGKAEYFALPPSLRAAYLSSPQFDQLLNVLAISQPTQRVLLCRRDAEFTRGPKRIQIAMAAASFISMGVTFGGSSLAIAALGSTAARVAIIGLDFGINSASLVVSGKQIAEACFAPEHAIQGSPAPSCSDTSGAVDFVSRADSAHCAVAAVFGASSAVYQSLTVIKAARLASPAR